MIKAGYSGSGINDVVYMGDVVNSAAKLASKGDMGWLVSGPQMVGSGFHGNLNDHNRSLLSWNATHSCYSGSVINVLMDEWYQANCP